MQTTLRQRGALFTAGLLLLANLIVPVLWGDVYPFTSAPMFREAPVACCQYRVFAKDGQELSPADWRLQRVYDGNPIGYGVGVRPPAVLEQKYGAIADEATVRRHVERQFALPVNQEHELVKVEQVVLGPASGGHVGVVAVNRWRIRTP